MATKMGKRKIYLALAEGEMESADAEIFNINGFEETFAVHICDKRTRRLFGRNYVVSELSTGLSIVKGMKNKALSIKAAKEKMNRYKDDWQRVKKEGIKTIKHYGYKFPLNK